MKDLSLNTTEALVFISNNELRTTSLKVAEVFGKRHADVLRAIDELLTKVSGSFQERNLALLEYTQENGLGIPVTNRMYELTRDGCMMLVMGFEGEKAMKVKEAYINEFNRMEAALKAPKPVIPLSKTEETIKSLKLISDLTLASVTGTDPGIMTTAFLSSVEKATGLPTEDFRRALPGIPVDAPANNATAIGKKLDMRPSSVNKLLMNLGLQFKNERGDWELTERGAEFGSMVPYTNNGHSGYQILWKNSLIDYLNEEAAA